MSGTSDRSRVGLVVAGLGLAAVGASYLARQQISRGSQHPPDSAPGRTARRRNFGDYAVTGKTVLINKPRAELFAFWRDFSNLASFMENVEAVRSEGDEMVWTIAAPAGQSVDIRTTIVEERDGEVIAWRSVEGSDIDTEGRVSFKDAPEGRGTYVEAIIAYKPPGGDLGRIVAKLFQREPAIQSRRELKRFKMLMETGEIATSSNRRTAA